ncbi:MAG: RNA helicase [Desulfovibrio sp.]|nr:RNA helicase [Desulfovibrio sp.]|tara:strand:+ start:546 stop:1772 length:1227 start_codon:yes stop_codon:yes gene_type:complete
MTFSTFSFDKRIVAGIDACGYSTPTPIQNQTIPLILKGHDVMGLAQTGTGKTAAFGLPILQRLVSDSNKQRTPRVLILAPTRELAQQINDNLKSLAGQTGIRSSIVIGGVGMGPQIRAFKNSNIIVACPGRLVGLLSNGSVHLKGIDTLVLDEADRMLDMGFMPDIKRILAQLPAKRQNLLFSATMPKPILELTKRILVNPKTVRINTVSPVTSVEHTFYKTHTKGKGPLLENFLARGEHQNVLIFTRTKRKARSLSRLLESRGYKSTFLQGNMSQNQRDKALKGFRGGQFPIMVATDIAARGIDCDRITHVVNYDMPDTLETYTHRIGRTGRAGRSGSAISLVTHDDASQVRAISRIIDVTVKQTEGCDHRQDAKPTGTRKPRSSSNSRKPNQRSRRRPGQGQRAAA